MIDERSERHDHVHDRAQASEEAKGIIPFIKIVLDTNVLVSALLTNGPPAAIIDLVADGKLTPFYNDLIITEYWDVLRRPKFGFNPLQINRLVNAITRIGVAVETEISTVISMKDEDDRIFYNIAKSSLSFLVTGNAKHFPPERFILSPADFLRKYHQGVLG